MNPRPVGAQPRAVGSCYEDARQLTPTLFVPLCLRVSHFKSPTINDDEGF